jgi:hypothetical protein
MLRMREDFTNETEGYFISEGTDWYEPYTDNRKRLFRECQKDYGRCISSIYVDTPNGTKTVGWYFERKEQYEDAGRYGRDPEYYIRGVWVHLRETEEEVTV